MKLAWWMCALIALGACATATPMLAPTPPIIVEDAPTAVPVLTPNSLATVTGQPTAPAQGEIAPTAFAAPPAASTARPNPSPNAAQVPEIRSVAIDERNDKGRYQITGVLPSIEGNARGAQEFTQYTKSQIDKRLAAFRKDMQTWKPAQTGSQSSSFNVRYNIETFTPDFVSVRVEYSSYYAGAAHPNAESLAINYDLKNIRLVQLDAQFSRRDYLNIVAGESKRQLAQRYGDSVNVEDLVPGAKIYNNWTISPAGLHLRFDEYTFAPHAVGPLDVTISKSAFGALLLAEGALNRYAR